MNNLKWPIETLFMGMQINDYNSTNAVTRRQHLDKWQSFAQYNNVEYAQTGFNQYKKAILTGTDVSLDITVNVGRVTGVATDFDGTVSGGNAEIAPGEYLVINGHPYLVASITSATVLELGVDTQPYPAAAIANSVDFYKYSVGPVTAHVDVCVRTIDTIKITAHSINIYDTYPAGFFNAYIPFRYGGAYVKTPDDCGVIMIPFNLYPGSYQPSGHLNVSRAREFYLEYTSSVISASTHGNLIVIASAINFLLISDGLIQILLNIVKYSWTIRVCTKMHASVCIH